MKFSITIAAMALALCASSAQAATEICTPSFSKTAQKALRSDTFYSNLVFKTHDVITVNISEGEAQTIVLHPQGRRVATADILHVIEVTAPNDDMTVITGKISVVDNQVISTEFCADQTELGT